MNIKKRLKSTKDFLKSYLHSYGIEDIDLFINPTEQCFDNPWAYDNMGQAAEMLHNHAGEDVCIVKDPDVDGECSTAIQYQFLRYIGCNPIVICHAGKQHGSFDIINQIIDSKCKLLWIADAGTNETDECNKLMEQGIDVICTDHHNQIKENPKCIIVNNQNSNVNKALSGCGVTYKFVQAYCDKYNLGCPDYNDLVATSIIADMCELTTYENRAFVHQGLNNPTNNFIKLLLEKECVRKGKTPEGISWCIAPLANALARVDEQETKLLFFDALIGKINYEQALKDIKRIKRQQDASVKDAVDSIEPTLNLDYKAIIGFTEPDNKNYIGLICNKFTGKYNKPTILLRQLNSTTWSGSLRSPIPLLETINNSKLAECSGHSEACGITVKKANLKRLQAFLETLDLSVDPEIEVTSCITTKDITLDLCQIIEDNKELWGQGLPCPQFYIELDNPETFIFEKKTTTIKLIKDGISFMLFFAKQNDVEALIQKNEKIKLIVTLGTNEYNGEISPQAIIQRYETEEKSESWEDLF